MAERVCKFCKKPVDPHARWDGPGFGGVVTCVDKDDVKTYAHWDCFPPEEQRRIALNAQNAV